MKLSFYIARRFLRAMGMVIGAFFAIMFFIEIFEQIRRFGPKGATLGDATVLAALVVPERIYNILPILMMLSGVVLFLGLARSSELVVIRAAGRSALRMLVAPVLTVLAVGAFCVAVLNPIIAASALRLEEVSAQLNGDGLASSARVSIGAEGLWLRQGATQDAAGNSAAGIATVGIGAAKDKTNDSPSALPDNSPDDSPDDLPDDSAQALATSQVVIHAARANLNATTLYDASFLVFSPDRGPIRRIDAQEAALGAQGWELRQVKDWPLGSSPNPERDAVLRETMTLPSDLTPERIRDGFGTPQAISIWHLRPYIAELERAGFSARRHAVWFQMELAMPFVLAAMVLIAAGFTMRHARAGGTGRMVMWALFAGLGVFFLRNIAQVLGENGQIPVALAAWAPPMIAGMLAMALLLHLEDG